MGPGKERNKAGLKKEMSFWREECENHLCKGRESRTEEIQRMSWPKAWTSFICLTLIWLISSGQPADLWSSSPWADGSKLGRLSEKGAWRKDLPLTKLHTGKFSCEPRKCWPHYLYYRCFYEVLVTTFLEIKQSNLMLKKNICPQRKQWRDHIKAVNAVPKENFSEYLNNGYNCSTCCGHYFEEGMTQMI